MCLTRVKPIMVLQAMWVSFGKLIKEAVERSHRPNVSSEQRSQLFGQNSPEKTKSTKSATTSR